MKLPENHSHCQYDNHLLKLYNFQFLKNWGCILGLLDVSECAKDIALRLCVSKSNFYFLLDSFGEKNIKLKEPI
jgi:hypothetical protein